MKRFVFALLALALAALPANAGGELGYPTDAFPLTGASGTVANASAVATLTTTAGHKAYLCGLVITSTGSTAAAVVAPTVTGLTGGTLTFAYATVAGATLQNPTISHSFIPCVPASAAGVNIVVTLPALGAGNTNATASAWGYFQ
jgi:hypothetical protein